MHAQGAVAQDSACSCGNMIPKFAAPLLLALALALQSHTVHAFNFRRGGDLQGVQLACYLQIAYGLSRQIC